MSAEQQGTKLGACPAAMSLVRRGSSIRLGFCFSLGPRLICTSES